MNAENNIAFKKRFCKDQNLPIRVFEYPYFGDRLVLMDAFALWNSFCWMIKEDFHDNPEEYFAAYDKAQDAIITKIRDSLTFQTMNTSCFVTNDTMKVGQREVYKEPNIGKEFISIDMSKANFSALVHFGIKYACPFYCNYDYSGFIKDGLKDFSFSDRFIENFANSKYLRQVIFGKCNSKKQVQYEKMLMVGLLNELLAKGLIMEGDIYSINSDEIILHGGCCDSIFENLVKEVQDWSKENVPLKIEKYTLAKIDGTQAYLKCHEAIPLIEQAKGMIPKCVNSLDAPFVYRLLRGEDFREEDKVFFHEGKLAKFMEFPFLTIRDKSEEKRDNKEKEEDDYEI